MIIDDSKANAPFKGKVLALDSVGAGVTGATGEEVDNADGESVDGVTGAGETGSEVVGVSTGESVGAITGAGEAGWEVVGASTGDDVTGASVGLIGAFVATGSEVMGATVATIGASVGGATGAGDTGDGVGELVSIGASVKSGHAVSTEKRSVTFKSGGSMDSSRIPTTVAANPSF